jgi:hypothetical protein
MSLDKKYEEVYRSKVQELVDEALRLCKEDSLEESIAIVRYILSFDRNNEFAKSTLKELINKKDKAIAYYDSIPFIVSPSNKFHCYKFFPRCSPIHL